MLPFAKYQGTGNDFVIVDARRLMQRDDADWSTLARRMCDRHFGAGADGLLLVCGEGGPARLDQGCHTGLRPRMRMFNPDGSEAEMCGNGLRCFARYLLDQREIGEGRLAVQTASGILQTVVERRSGSVWVTVDMGIPRWLTEPETVLDLGEASILMVGVSMGNPHAVARVEDAGTFPLEQLGPRVERHPRFPNGTNFAVYQVLSPSTLQTRVWERGAGATLACGTGACATAVVARRRGEIEPTVEVRLPGGRLTVTWAGGEGESVLLRGPAEAVYTGTWLEDVGS
jgi:diaminopimelate epimerase